MYSWSAQPTAKVILSSFGNLYLIKIKIMKRYILDTFVVLVCYQGVECTIDQDKIRMIQFQPDSYFTIVRCG